MLKIFERYDNISRERIRECIISDTLIIKMKVEALKKKSKQER